MNKVLCEYCDKPFLERNIPRHHKTGCITLKKQRQLQQEQQEEQRNQHRLSLYIVKETTDYMEQVTTHVAAVFFLEEDADRYVQENPGGMFTTRDVETVYTAYTQYYFD